MTVGLTLALLVLWPMPMFGSGYIFSEKVFPPPRFNDRDTMLTNGLQFFTGWVIVGIIWLFASSVMVIFLPVFESRRTIVRTTRLMF